jgi:hypothetical protein
MSAKTQECERKEAEGGKAVEPDADTSDAAEVKDVVEKKEYEETDEKFQDDEGGETVTEEERVDVSGGVIDERVLGGDLRFNLPSPTTTHSSLASTLPLNHPDGSPPSSPIPGGTCSRSRQAILPYLGWLILFISLMPQSQIT